jgi:hypothetical protein
VFEGINKLSGTSAMVDKAVGGDNSSAKFQQD